MINGITASLANAARKIVEDSRAKAAEESALNIAKLQEKMMKPAHSGTAPRNDQERKLAAMTPPTDKITHGDVLKGRGVKKEEIEHTNEAKKPWSPEPASSPPNPKDADHKKASMLIDKIRSYRYLKQDYKEKGNLERHREFHAKLHDADKQYQKLGHNSLLRKDDHVVEEVEQTDEAMSHQAATTMKHIKPGTLKQNYGDKQDAANIKPGIKGVADRLAMLDRAKKEGRLKEEEEIVNEAPMDGVAPGSMEDGKHMCATKVFHKEWKEGKPLFSQHAEPDWNADGYIAWYDIMFEHGIEKRVPVTELNILTQESHMHSKKKKM